MKTRQNKLNLKISFFIFLFALLILNSSFLVKEVFAQQRIPLTVAPARQTVAIDAGKSEMLQIKFFNESSSPISGNLKVVDFIVTGKNGAPILLEDQPNDWVKLPFDKATIPSGDVLKINFKVEVPKGAEPGGRYAAIMFEQVGQLSESSGSESASAISSRIVGLVSIRVNGLITESAFVNIFKLPKFLEFGKIPVYFEIMNKGGYHITPTGQITLTNWRNKEIERVTLEEKNIFPGVSRSYEESLGETWMFGRYKVNLVASFGDQGKTVLAESFVWVIPVTVIVIIIFSILILILTIYLISRGVKAKQEVLENKLEEEISELEAIKNKFKDKLPK